MNKFLAVAGLATWVVLLCGCHSVGSPHAPGAIGKGESDETAIRRVIETWKDATVARNLPKLMTLYSDDFEHKDWNGKKGFESFLRDGIEMGYLNRAVVNSEDTRIDVDNGIADVYPINLNAQLGAMVIRLRLARESQGWMIVGMTMEMAAERRPL